MKNKIIKPVIAAFVLGTCIVSFTGCSMFKMLGIETKQEADVDTQNYKEKKISEEPKITRDLSGEILWGIGQQAEALSIEASTTGEGTLSYQWYRNNTAMNGGGTPIDGATQPTYIPDTSELGETYYYVVVANTTSEEEIPGMATSSIVKVTVQQDKVLTEEEKAAQEKAAEEKRKAEEDAANAKYEGTWKQDAKGWWFKRPDGTFAKNEWIKDKDKWYVFDEQGYMIKGWYKYKESWYYLGRDGHMIVDFDVDGYHLGPDGKMVE